MIISELQKRLQEMYEKYGDVEVVIEDTDYTGVEKYHFEVSRVKEVECNGYIAAALASY